MEKLSQKKQPRVDSSEFEFESANAKKIREHLLSLLDDPDTVPDHDLVSLSHDLDSVIRSFEEELSGSKSSSNLFDLETGTGEVLPEMGELNWVGTELQSISELWDLDFQDDLLSYDLQSISVGNVTGEVGHPENGKEYLTLDGIFHYSDENFGSGFYLAL